MARPSCGQARRQSPAAMTIMPAQYPWEVIPIPLPSSEEMWGGEPFCSPRRAGPLLGRGVGEASSAGFLRTPQSSALAALVPVSAGAAVWTVGVSGGGSRLGGGGTKCVRPYKTDHAVRRTNTGLFSQGDRTQCGGEA